MCPSFQIVLLNYDPSAQAAATYGMTTFIIVWSATGTHKLLKRSPLVRKVTGLDNHHNLVYAMFGNLAGLRLVLRVIDTIAIPLIVFMLTSPECFRGIFEAQEDNLNYEHLRCIVWRGTPPECSDYRVHTFETRMLAPFRYRFLCSTAIVAAYSSVYMLQYIQLLLFSFAKIAALYLLRDELVKTDGAENSSDDESQLSGLTLVTYEFIVQNLVPRLIWTDAMHGVVAAKKRREGSFDSKQDLEGKMTETREVYTAEDTTIQACTGILIIVTIGTVSPLVTLIVATSVWIDMVVQHVMIGVFLSRNTFRKKGVSTNDRSRDILKSIDLSTRRFERDCGHPSATLWKSRYFMAATMTLTHSWVTYDIFADAEVGWTPSLMYLAPFVAGEFVLTHFRLMDSDKDDEKMAILMRTNSFRGSFNDDNGPEQMTYTNNPLHQHQRTLQSRPPYPGEDGRRPPASPGFAVQQLQMVPSTPQPSTAPPWPQSRQSESKDNLDDWTQSGRPSLDTSSPSAAMRASEGRMSRSSPKLAMKRGLRY